MNTSVDLSGAEDPALPVAAVVTFTPGYELSYDVDPHGDLVPTFEADE